MSKKNVPKKSPLPGKKTPPKRQWGRILRVGLFFFLLIVLPASYYFNLVVLKSDILSQRGYMILDKLKEDRRALSYYEEAYKTASFNALNQYRMASLILRGESLKLVNRGPQTVNEKKLAFSLDLLREARKGHHSPWAVILRSAQTAAILGEVHKAAGDRKKADAFYQIASENYYGFSKLALKPRQEPDIFYRGALEYSLGCMQPQLALKHFDDYHYYYGEKAITNKAIRQRAVESYYVMGEFQMMLMETANQLYATPDDNAWLQRLYHYGKTVEGGHDFAVIVLKELEERGDLTESGRAMLEELRGEQKATGEV